MRVLRFAAVGVANTAIDYGLYWLLLAAGAAPQPANIASIAAAASFSFAANRGFTFAAARNATPLPGQIARHAAVTVSAMALSALVIGLLLPELGALAAKAVAIPAVFAWNYALSSRWVWARAR